MRHYYFTISKQKKLIRNVYKNPQEIYEKIAKQFFILFTRYSLYVKIKNLLSIILNVLISGTLESKKEDAKLKRMNLKNTVSPILIYTLMVEKLLQQVIALRKILILALEKQYKHFPIEVLLAEIAFVHHQ